MDINELYMKYADVKPNQQTYGLTMSITAFTKAIAEVISLPVEAGVMQKPAGKWISVDEQLPELNTGVLCWVELVDLDGDKYNTISTGQRFINYTGKAVFVPSISGFIKGSRVTHWMPLPEPPES